MNISGYHIIAALEAFLLVALVLVSTIVATGVTETAFLGAAFLVLILLFGFTIAFAAFKREYKWSLTFVVVGVFAFAVGQAIQMPLAARFERRTQAAGDSLVLALARFHEQRGTAPDSLEQLVPDFMEAVPSPAFFRSRFYLGGDSSIAYNGPAWTVCTRGIGSPWVCDD
ncbi:MAG: hypothetical protein GF418_04630 [Chitinivibrionales bacterium]|nr:hypothetical protein [Chitinivibrionales bacterium]MBD3394894.1 hypothetical protein [Chitinivibrionales bacterium]